MLESLSLQNFQAHRSLKIDLEPGLNVIVGSNGVGKSTIVRALRWLLLNEAPKSFMTWESSFAKVIGVFERKTIKRQRGSKGNLYFLEDKAFEAVRTNVPDEISTLLNIGEANFQGQHDGLFWFNDSAGNISKRLNRIINLEKIDGTLANISSKLSDARSIVKLTENRLSEAQKAKQELDWVVEADEAFKIIEAKLSIQESFDSEITKINEIITRTDEIKSRRSSEAAETFKEIFKLSEKAYALTKEEDVLTSLLKRWEDIKPMPDDLWLKWDSIQEKTNLISILTEEERNITDLFLRVEILEKEVKKKLDECVGLEQELKDKCGNVCPVCGKKF